MRLRAVYLGLLCAAALLGCGDEKPPMQPLPPPPGFLEPDFALPDSNPNSTTYTQVCSPRQHLGRISAWYFGYST
jgi:hypothetical protein